MATTIDTSKPHGISLAHSPDGDGIQARCLCGFTSKSHEGTRAALAAGNRHLTSARKAVAKDQAKDQAKDADGA